MDRVSPEKRSWNMSRIKSKNTTPERIVRSFLYGRGFRFRLHIKKLPGSPDIVLKKHKTVIEVRGCFWHRHPGCKYTTIPVSNSSFWERKFQQNVERDKRTDSALNALGWRVIVIWECEVKNGSFRQRIEKELPTHNKR